MGRALSPTGGTRTTSGSRSGTTPSTPTGRRGRRSTVTSRPTSRSSAPASPGSGPPTTSPRPTPSCGSWCSRPRPPGFGASGRNGGWCSALFPASPRHARRATPTATAALAQHRAMRETVDEVGRVAAAEGIDAHVAKGGTIALARSRAQWSRARAEVADARAWGRGEDDVRLLGRAEATAVLRGSRHPRRDVHPGLRGAPPRPPGPRPGRRGRAARRHDPRADPGHRDRAAAAPAPSTASCAPRTVLRATEGYTATAAPASGARWCRSTR